MTAAEVGSDSECSLEFTGTVNYVGTSQSEY